VPLCGEQVDGVLLLVMPKGSTDLGGDLELLVSFANQAALALERARAQLDRESLAVFADRERIARDLHDLVIQRLFATGLQLQGAYRLAVRSEVQRRIATAVDDLDTTIHDIRTSIFAMHHLPSEADSVRADLAELIKEYASTLGFPPRLVLAGPVDTLVTGETREHVVAVAREALSNVARHARASGVIVELSVGADGVSLRVADDGVGCSGDPGNGLPNMRARAESLGGSAGIVANAPHGTVVEWAVPRP
jgi:signal transduction histidine kinase